MRQWPAAGAGAGDPRLQEEAWPRGTVLKCVRAPTVGAPEKRHSRRFTSARSECILWGPFAPGWRGASVARLRRGSRGTGDPRSQEEAWLRGVVLKRARALAIGAPEKRRLHWFFSAGSG
ncbi:hypothetical protein NDU88_001928 [Pleurodeles waltl]|uniref:Uncharacterized protein n=1 Tax=Pleurodeles waltl TaxID=8319 RepID=A0AAV7SA60_PLEWA|nr:hypothetical protein NDU88_001928 [Pleurodeles waltl]